jgi:hypothetical protein
VCPAPQRAQLLQFCTGSARAPATGFAELMGYGGNQQRFCLQRVRTLRRALATFAHARSRKDERRVLTELTSTPWPGLLNRWRGRVGGCRRPPPASTRCGCRRARPPSPHDDRPSTLVGGLDFGLHLPKAAPSRAGAASEVAGAGTRARRRSGSGCGPRWPTPRASTSTPSRSERGAQRPPRSHAAVRWSTTCGGTGCLV